MKQYEISNDGKYIGKINLHKENIRDNIKNTIIETPSNLTFKFDKTEQTYELSFVVNDIDCSPALFEKDRPLVIILASIEISDLT